MPNQSKTRNERLQVLETFAGIGGFALAWERLGFEHIQFVEIDPFCQAVLRKHWPEVPIHGDIKTFSALALRGRVDLITGGPPCQPASVAGKRKGVEDARWLWPEFLRVVREALPRWVVAENPPGIVNLKPHGLEWIIGELEGAGYEVLPVVVGADDVGAPHRRKRVWIVAHRRHGEPQGPEGTDGLDAERAPQRGRKLLDAGIGAGREPGAAGGVAAAGAAEPSTEDAGSDALAHRVSDPVRDEQQRVSGGRSGGVRDEGQAEPRGDGEAGVADSNLGRQQSERCSRVSDRDSALWHDPDRRGERAVGDASHDHGRTGERGAEEGAGQDGERRRGLTEPSARRWPARPGEPQHDFEPPRLSLFEVGSRLDEPPPGLVRSITDRCGWSDAQAETWWNRNQVRVSRFQNRQALKALGNAVVPLCAEVIGRAILAVERSEQ